MKSDLFTPSIGTSEDINPFPISRNLVQSKTQLSRALAVILFSYPFDSEFDVPWASETRFQADRHFGQIQDHLIVDAQPRSQFRGHLFFSSVLYGKWFEKMTMTFYSYPGCSRWQMRPLRPTFGENDFGLLGSEVSFQNSVAVGWVFQLIGGGVPPTSCHNDGVGLRTGRNHALKRVQKLRSNGLWGTFTNFSIVTSGIIVKK